MRVGGRRWMRLAARLGPVQLALQVGALVALVLGLAGVDAEIDGWPAYGIGGLGLLLLLAIGVPGLLSWGHFQVHIQRNARLDGRARWRWRVAFWLLGLTPTLYWRRHVRDAP